MAATYSPQSVGITATNLQNGGWYNGRQFYNGQVGDPGVIINPSQQGAGQAVSSEVNAQSAAAQGVSTQNFNQYLQDQAKNNPSTPGGTFGGDSGATGSAAGGSGGDIAGAFTANPSGSTLNLPDLNNTLNQQYGTKNLEDQLTAKSQAYNDAQSKINDNPYLSEATRVGRIAKLTNDYNNDVKTTQDSLTMARQDIQTQLSLQTQQFQIDSQQAVQAQNEFNTLLSSGALAGASGNDIAAITKATGISSSMIQSAIAAQTKKDTPTSIIPFDDGTNQGFAVVNTQTGAIISRQNVAASKPTSSGSGGNPGSTEYNANLIASATPDILSKLNKTGQISPTDYNKIKGAFLSGGGSIADFNNTFGGYADTNRADFSSAYGFTNPNPTWSSVYPGHKIGSTISSTDANGKITQIKITK